MTKFQKGDIVRLKTGHADIYVTNSSGRSVKGYYVKCGMKKSWTANEYFGLVTAAKVTTVTSDPWPNRSKYCSKSTGQVFPYIGRTTNGKLVLESNNGMPFNCPIEDWEKVVPFTFQVKFVESKQHRSFVGTQGDVAVGDRLQQQDGKDCYVVAINTKVNKTERFVGKRYVLEDLK